MGSWILDFSLVSLAVLLMAVVIYKLLFSAAEDTRRELALRPKPRFERREVERRDRRIAKQAPPDGVERRQGPRR